MATCGALQGEKIITVMLFGRLSLVLEITTGRSESRTLSGLLVPPVLQHERVAWVITVFR
jgi:hypothetical protein